MTSKPKKSSPKKFSLIAIIVVLLLAVIAFLPTDYYLESPGEVFAVGQFVKTNRAKPNNLNLVTVSVSSRPIPVGAYLWSFTQPFDERVSSKELLGGQTSSQYDELQNWYMETSQQNAIYAAAKKAGLKPKLKYLGVYVMSVQKDSSFKNKLQIGDTVVAANGYRFHSIQEMQRYLNRQPLNSKVTISVLRNQEKKRFAGKIVKLANTSRKGIGIQLVEHVAVTTTPKIEINAGAIGGPSAGLMFSLESYEIFSGQHLAKGHKIAGTGTIAPNGDVGIIGGVDKKVVAADREQAEVFFAPTDATGVKKNQTNYVIARKTARRIHSKMKIVPVKHLSDAIDYLKKHY